MQGKGGAVNGKVEGQRSKERRKAEDWESEVRSQEKNEEGGGIVTPPFLM
jgi:hypothetical protein